MPKRLRLATGIYEDAHGRSVIVHVHGKPQEHRFERDRPLDLLVRWRKREIAKTSETAPRVAGSTLTRDAVRYLKRLKGLPSYRSEKSHLRAWLIRFGALPRWLVTSEKCELAIADWRTDGYSARTIIHRVRALAALYHRLDGPKADTPVDNAILPPKPRPRALSVSDVTIEAVALEMRKHEIAGLLRDAKSRARFLVLATHSQRPAELQRTKPEDVTPTVWAVRAAKGGYNVAVPLNDEQRAAWQLFIAANAWGHYDSRSFSKLLQRCGWPKGIRPYNLRHSTGIALSKRGVPIEDIQALMSHTSPTTTRQFYVPGLIERLADATQLLDGRFGGAAFFPRAVTTKATGRHAKDSVLLSNSEPEQTDTARRAGRRLE